MRNSRHIRSLSLAARIYTEGSLICASGRPKLSRGQILVSIVLLAAMPVSLGAQDIIRDVEYISGRAGHTARQKGMLMIWTDMVQFHPSSGPESDAAATPNMTTFGVTAPAPPPPTGGSFDIPTDSITDVTNEVDVRGASFGAKLMIGFLASDRKQEFVSITYEGPTYADAILFKVNEHQSPGIVAKIRFAMKRRRRTAVKDSTMRDSAAATP